MRGAVRAPSLTIAFRPSQAFLALGRQLCSQVEPRNGRRISLAGVLTAAVAASAWLLVGGAASSANAAGDPCANADARTGVGRNLPDCRAYELVTPPELKTIPQTGPGGFGGTTGGDLFNSPPTTPAGDGFMFQVGGSALPGLPGNGRVNQYFAERGAAGWTSTPSSPDGTQVDYPGIGGFSADHGYAANVALRKSGAEPQLSLDLDPSTFFPSTSWIRYPDGVYHLTGEGTIPTDPDTDGYDNGFIDDIHARADWISAGGEHIIFDTLDQGSTPLQLTEDAPADGTPAVYDRTADGLHVVSLLPGEVTPTNKALFKGSSADGSTVLFSIGSELYARVNDAKTLDLGAVTAAGISADGSVVYYKDAGNISSIDTASEQVTPVVSTGDAKPVLLGPDGGHFYFLSGQQLDGPSNGSPGGNNLYVAHGGNAQFIGEVSAADTREALAGAAAATRSALRRLGLSCRTIRRGCCMRLHRLTETTSPLTRTRS